MKYLFTSFALLFTKILIAQNLPFDQKTFDAWVDARVGNGKSTAIWYCYGEVYSYPDGKLVSRMEGVDLGNLIRVSADSVIQLNRKIFIYIDPITNETLYEYNGRPVQHIEYPYQMITYVRRDNRLVSYVEQGKTPRITKMGPGYNTSARKLGETLVFSSPVFLNFPTPNGKYEAYENYDFFVDYTQQKTANRYQLTWNRFGDLPLWAGEGKSVIQLICHRVDRFEELSPALKKHITERAPLWLAAPKDIAEIRELQK